MVLISNPQRPSFHGFCTDCYPTDYKFWNRRLFGFTFHERNSHGPIGRYYYISICSCLVWLGADANSYYTLFTNRASRSLPTSSCMLLNQPYTKLLIQKAATPTYQGNDITSTCSMCTHRLGCTSISQAGFHATVDSDLTFKLGSLMIQCEDINISEVAQTSRH